MGEIAILSDIHGNLTALESVFDELNPRRFEGIVLLGDLIDYGPCSNEVLRFLIERAEQEKILANIWGNHERAVMTKDFGGFSTQRGADSAKATAESLDAESYRYMERMNSCGKQEFFLGKCRCLAIHGSLEEPFWKSIEPDDVNGDYREYDYVFSGHSHCPHMFARFYRADNPRYRDRKRTVFINPGSVGQPRNHNPRASYAILDLESGRVELRNCLYDVEKEQRRFRAGVDHFYKMRLERGI